MRIGEVNAVEVWVHVVQHYLWGWCVTMHGIGGNKKLPDSICLVQVTIAIIIIIIYTALIRPPLGQCSWLE